MQRVGRDDSDGMLGGCACDGQLQHVGLALLPLDGARAEIGLHRDVGYLCADGDFQPDGGYRGGLAAGGYPLHQAY